MTEEETIPEGVGDPTSPPPEPSSPVEITATRYVATTGQVHGFFQSTMAMAVANLGDGEALWMGEIVDGATHYISGTPLQSQPRPMVVIPTPTAAPWTWDLSTLPAGTTITIRNEIGDTLEITDLADPLELVDAGMYQMRLSPPFPWLALNATIEVPDA